MSATYIAGLIDIFTPVLMTSSQTDIEKRPSYYERTKLGDASQSWMSVTSCMQKGADSAVLKCY